MRITDLSHLTDLAERVYRDPGFTMLRAKADDREALVYNQLPVLVPEKMTNRIRQVHQGAAMDKVSRGMALITDPLGVRIEVAKVGKSEKAELLRERVRAWLLSFWKDLERRGAQDGTLDWLVKWGVIVHSVCAVRVQPYTAAWAPLLAGKTKKKELDLTDTSTPDEVAERVNEFLAEAAGLAETDADDITRRIPPFQITYVPGHCIRWESDQFSRHLGPKWVMEYREMSVEDVLDTYLDADGKPLAADLARQVERRDLTPEDTVVVVIRADREHLQIFLADMALDQMTGDPVSVRRHGMSALLYEGEHGLGRTPYAIFTGRVTPARELVHRFQGLLDPAYELFIELDQLATQISSVRNFVAWPLLYVSKYHDSQGGVATGDRVAAIDLEEGTVIDGTGPGEKLETVPMTSREGLEWLQRDYEMKMAAADRLTFGGAAYGANSIDSGYAQQLQESATTSTMEPFRLGCERGYEDFFQLVLTVARVLHQRGLPAIPVRSCLPEGREWEELDSRMTDFDWDITVSIQQQHPAGKMAHLNAIAFAEDRGYMTHEEAIRESGNPYPLQVIQQRDIETYAADPQMRQFIAGLIQQQFMAALAQEQAGAMPMQPLVPPALATTLAPMAGNPALGAMGARLPQLQPGQMFGVPGVSNQMALPPGQPTGIPLGPNLAAQNPAPPPPTPRAATVRQGGGFAGEGQSSPGGMRQDYQNSLRR